MTANSAVGDANQDRLGSWKDVAAYLGRGVRTVQRWEREHGLPVHRAAGAAAGQVFAYRGELDAWWEARAATLAGDVDAETKDGPVPGRPATPPATEPYPREQRLDSWKEVANYLRRGSRTVQRWEREEGLPIRRLRHDQRSSVYAYQPELDAWLASRGMALAEPAVRPGLLRRPRVQAVGGALAVAMIALGWATVRQLPGYRDGASSLDVRSLTALPGAERHPTFSPDGQMVAFDWNGDRQDNHDVYVKPVAGGKMVRLTTDPEPEVDPVWSPDGRWIAFLRLRKVENDEIWVTPPVGGPARKVADLSLTQNALPRPYLAWTADSQWLIAPEQAGQHGPHRLTLISLATGEKRVLTQPPEQSLGDSAAAVSRDGREVAFVRCQSLRAYSLQWGHLAPDLASIVEPVRITSDFRILYSPMWVDSGRALLFAGANEEEPALWRVAWPRGGTPRKVLRHVGYHASISQRGDKLAYSDSIPRRNLYRVDLQPPRGGSAQPVRITHSTRTDLGPDVSPDGRQLVFMSNRGDAAELWIANADGAESRQLTATGGTTPASPRYSPDGKRVAFEMRAAGNADLYTVDAAGGTPQRLTAEPSEESVPSWSRDGRWIYFCSDRTGRREIWKMPAAGGVAVQVTRGGGTAAIESVDGRTVYFARASADAKNSVWQTPVEGGEETEVVDGLWNRHNFAVTAKGIYLTSWQPGQTFPAILFYRYATRRVETVARLSHAVAQGLAVWPPDHPRSLWYTAQERPEADLTLVRNLKASWD